MTEPKRIKATIEGTRIMPDPIIVQAQESVSITELEHLGEVWTKTVVARLLAEVIRHAQKTGQDKPKEVQVTVSTIHPHMKTAIRLPWLLKLTKSTTEPARENAKVVQQRRATRTQ